MTGHIRTSNGSFFIEPVEEWQGHTTMLTHRFYKVPALPGSLSPPLSSQQPRPHALYKANEKKNLLVNHSRRVLVIPADSDTAAPTQTDDHRTADPRTADHSLDVFTSRTSLAT
ncbi:hypothetical protein J6590_048628 [Homalodisca vitripennis]|nr:hypothetical protein J6590_048628 [Homalodisca vitripennis]